MKKIKDAVVISSKQFNNLFKGLRNPLEDPFDFVEATCEDGLQYHIWKDRRNGKKYAVRQISTVYFGLNDIPKHKVNEFCEIVEKEGACNASWDCTGRTLHLSLANQLAKMLPQYEFEVGYNYKCIAHKPGKEK